MKQVFEFIKSYIYPIVIVILAFICIGAITKCSRNEQNIKENQAYTTEIKKVKDKLAGDIFVERQNFTNQKQLNESLKDSIRYFKDISSKVSVTTNTKIKEVPVEIEKPIYIQDQVGKNYLLTPATFGIKHEWYSLQGTITNKGTLIIDSLNIVNKLDLYSGKKRRTFGEKLLFRPSDSYVAVKNHNPFTTTSEISNITIQAPKRHNFSLGVGPGISLGKNGIQPSINAGIYFNLINF